jgi:hypothetical protein
MNDLYYSKRRHTPWLEKCTTFGELSEVVIDVLQHMHQLFPEETFYQVCGPITTGPGTIREKLLLFERAITYQRRLGRIVFNQLPTEKKLAVLWGQWKEKAGRNPDDYCFELLEEFYYPVLTSGLIQRLCFLPNWQMSIGARWEWRWGSILGLRIEEFPPDWDKV